MTEPMAHVTHAQLDDTHNGAGVAATTRPWPSPSGAPSSSFRSFDDSPISSSTNLAANKYNTNGGDVRAGPFKNPFVLSFDQSFAEESGHTNGTANNTPVAIGSSNGVGSDPSLEARIAATRRTMMGHVRSRTAADLSTDLELEIGTGPEGNQHVTVSRTGLISGWASRVLISRNFVIACFLLGSINLFLFIFSLVKWGSSGAHSVAKEDGWYVALDIIASLAFFFEITLRIIASPKTYFDSCLNIFDLIVMLFCVLALLMYVFDPDDARVKSIVLVVRYLAQCARLYTPLKHFKKGRAAAGAVTFNDDMTTATTDVSDTIDESLVGDSNDDITTTEVSQKDKENARAALFLRGTQVDSSDDLAAARPVV